MRYAYYPGCSLRSSGSEFDVSLCAICEKLGIELVEPKGWICCGSTPAHALSKLLGLSLPWYNLIEIKKTGLPEVVVPCASCFARLKTAQDEVKDNAELANEIEGIIGKKLVDGIKISHPLEIFSSENMLQEMPKLIVKDLSGLKIACYYGCLLTRPPKVMQFDECEYPQTMDKVLQCMGMETIDWCYKTECCGAALAISRTDIVLELCLKIFEEAKSLGADGIAVACPLCHANLDGRQGEIEHKYNKEFQLPIFYFSQLMGLALGVSYEDLGLEKHFVEPSAVIEKCLK